MNKKNNRMNTLRNGTGFFLALIFSCKALFAQNEDDALRYSRTMFGGTARSIGLAGASGAMGADFSALSVNPAGAGLYRRSEFTLSPQLLIRSAKSRYLGSSGSDENVALNFQNWGIVFSGKTESAASEGPGWRRFTFGVGYNRLADFGSRFFASGQNSSGSYLDVLRDQANGFSPDMLDPNSTLMAYNSYLISPFPDSIAPKQYFTEMPAQLKKSQSRTIEQRGGIGETVITIAGNYSDRLFLGGTLGFQRVRFNQTNTYSEKDLDNQVRLDFFDEITELTTEGTGLNLKLGALYMPADFVRIGFSVHTPTFFRLSDQFQTFQNAKFDTLPVANMAESPIGNFDYRLRTPFRMVGSAAFIFAKLGLLSIDYEFVDYRDAVLRSQLFSFSQANSNTASKYRIAGNLRVGTEWKIMDFYLRGGYALYGTPFQNNSLGGEMSGFTGGFGYRNSNLFFDAGFFRTSMNQSQYMYNSNYNSNLVNNEIRTLALVFTVGIKF